MESEYDIDYSSTSKVEFDILSASFVSKDRILTRTGILITILNLFSFVALYRCLPLSFQIQIFNSLLTLDCAVYQYNVT